MHPDVDDSPPAAEPLVTGEVSPGHRLVAGELTLSFDNVFTPDRVGSTQGSTETKLVGRLCDDPQHPGTDYQNQTLYPSMGLERVRLGRYRWRLTELALDAPRVSVVVDRVAFAPKLRAPALDDDGSCTFWLSTQGVQDLELEATGFQYQDYVEVELGAYARAGQPWNVLVRARRVLKDHETVSWEHVLAKDAVGVHTMLGDHRLEIFELAWLSDSPAEVHVRFWLQRGTTASGMTRAAPPPPRVPFS